MKAIRIAANALLMAIVVVLLILGIPTLFGVQYFAVLSGSMEPAIPVGSLVASVPEDASRIQVGDVVSYVADESKTIVTHRVVGVDPREKTLTTRGDQGSGDGVEVLDANVVGVVRLSVPGLGYPLSYLSTIPGKIALVLAILALFLVGAIVNALTKKRAAKKQLVIEFSDPRELTVNAFDQIKHDVEQGETSGGGR